MSEAHHGYIAQAQIVVTAKRERAAGMTAAERYAPDGGDAS